MFGTNSRVPRPKQDTGMSRGSGVLGSVADSATCSLTPLWVYSTSVSLSSLLFSYSLGDLIQLFSLYIPLFFTSRIPHSSHTQHQSGNKRSFLYFFRVSYYGVVRYFFAMSYDYLFKYIIIGDTGPPFFLLFSPLHSISLSRGMALIRCVQV